MTELIAFTDSKGRRWRRSSPGRYLHADSRTQVGHTQADIVRWAGPLSDPEYDSGENRPVQASRLDLVWIDGVCYDADAVEVGRRAGLEQAAQIADRRASLYLGTGEESQAGAMFNVAYEIRDLLAADPAPATVPSDVHAQTDRNIAGESAYELNDAGREAGKALDPERCAALIREQEDDEDESED